MACEYNKTNCNSVLCTSQLFCSPLWQNSIVFQSHLYPTSLKQKCRHFDEIFITGCTGSCHFDNFQCSQWWTFHQNEDFSVSMLEANYMVPYFTSRDEVHRWWSLLIYTRNSMRKKTVYEIRLHGNISVCKSRLYMYIISICTHGFRYLFGAVLLFF